MGKADSFLRWTNTSERTWSRRNEGVQIAFGSPLPGSGKKYMVYAGVIVEASWTIIFEDLIQPWLQTRFERPLVCLATVE